MYIYKIFIRNTLWQMWGWGVGGMKSSRTCKKRRGKSGSYWGQGESGVGWLKRNNNNIIPPFKIHKGFGVGRVECMQTLPAYIGR
uniref:Putative ovule protein n=1 Tax=Solanum chacoense TaxID=4108 RepID=A0A0V0H3W5_SOLCH